MRQLCRGRGRGGWGVCLPPQRAHKLARKLQQIVGQAGLCTSKGRGMFSSTQSQQRRRRGRRQRRRRAGGRGRAYNVSGKICPPPYSLSLCLHPTQLAPGYKVNKILATQRLRRVEEGTGQGRQL